MQSPIASARGVRRTAVRGTSSGGVALLASLAAPSVADAHGLAAKADLPIPAWLFAWAATVVLVVSFAGLAVLWRRPVLARSRSRRLMPFGRPVDVVLGAFGIAFFAVVCWAGLTGTVVATTNLAPNAVWVAFWVGMPILSALFGDVFRLLSPWRALARAAGSAAKRVLPGGLPEPSRWPRRLGCWPAVAGLALMAWLELASSWRDEPSTLAVLALAYLAVQLIGISVWGVDTWTARGDAFGVAFSLISRIAPFERLDGRLSLRLPLSALSDLPREAGTQAVALVMIGATTFDGFSQGPAWPDAAAWLGERARDVGFGATAAAEAASTVGLAVALVAVSLIWFAGTAGAATALGAPRRGTAAMFAGVLVPIALAYTVAHYASLLVFQGQAFGYLASDPAGTGADWFGTAGWSIDYGVIGPTAIWWIQVAALVLGHVAALMVAHDKALELAPDSATATRSQLPMLVATVAFTTLGLWLLSAANL